MNSFRFASGLLIATCLMACPARAAEAVAIPAQHAEMTASDFLKKYLTKVDPSYRWQKVRQGEFAGTQYVELILTSQTWRGTEWKHRLFILKPENVSPAKQGLLVIAGGSWKQAFENPDFRDEQKVSKEAILFSTVAQQVRCPVAVLMQVPFQPLFDGLVEDEIIALTFDEFLKTADPEWPLLLPMVKSAVRGMDAVQEFCQQQWSIPVEHFTVTGASKRGWTTWLTGASDRRVTAIAPIVIDMLNMPVQLKHQMETWGEFSEEIHDYTEKDLPERLESAEAAELISTVDPIAYRKSLTAPKLIILGTNDRYWTLDALNLYWDKLLGPKYILYVPNNGHGIKDFPRVLGGIAALQEQAQGGPAMPQLTWSFHDSGDGVSLTIESDVAPIQCQLWTAETKSKDFRESVWMSAPMAPQGDNFTGEISAPESGSRALFGEAVYERGQFPLYLSTNVRILTAPGMQVSASDAVQD